MQLWPVIGPCIGYSTIRKRERINRLTGPCYGIGIASLLYL